MREDKKEKKGKEGRKRDSMGRKRIWGGGVEKRRGKGKKGKERKSWRLIMDKGRKRVGEEK